MVWVDELQMFALLYVSECSFVAGNALIGKALEDLLKSSLGDAVLLNAQVALLLLELAE